MFGAAGLFLMGLGQQGQPAEATGLNHRKINLLGFSASDSLALLLHQQPQSQVMKGGH
jgi:hypothetical protein